MKSAFEPDALLRAANLFGTPTYVYSEQVISAKCNELQRHLSGVPYRLLYAMKANGSPAVLRIMLDEGLGIDAVSPGELHLALKVGFPPEQILFSANNMTDGEMWDAAEAGVLLNIGELSRLEKFGRYAPGSAVCVRLNPQVGAGHHAHVITAGARSKFGVPVEQADAVRAIAEKYGLQIVGLHQHIGSGIMSTDTLWKAMTVLLEVAPSFPNVQFLNFGGGLGVPYNPADEPIDLENFGRRILDPLRSFADRHPSENLSFWFEPGRFLSAEAGVLLVRVNTLKTNGDRVFAGTDSGMNHLVRPAIYGSYHGIFNLSNPNGPTAVYDVTGNICESGDVFACARDVQEIHEGDVLAILDAGAYGMAMASHYNLRPLPAEALLTSRGELQLVRRRRTYTELADDLLSDAPEMFSGAENL